MVPSHYLLRRLVAGSDSSHSRAIQKIADDADSSREGSAFFDASGRKIFDILIYRGIGSTFKPHSLLLDIDEMISVGRSRIRLHVDNRWESICRAIYDTSMATKAKLCSIY